MSISFKTRRGRLATMRAHEHPDPHPDDLRPPSRPRRPGLRPPARPQPRLPRPAAPMACAVWRRRPPALRPPGGLQLPAPRPHPRGAGGLARAANPLGARYRGVRQRPRPQRAGGRRRGLAAPASDAAARLRAPACRELRAAHGGRRPREPAALAGPAELRTGLRFRIGHDPGHHGGDHARPLLPRRRTAGARHGRRRA